MDGRGALPVGPYPILVIHGEQGSAKSTITRVARHLIDPHESPLLAMPNTPRDLVITAYNGWVLALDNISHLPRLADALCGSRPVAGSRAAASSPAKHAMWCTRSGPPS